MPDFAGDLGHGDPGVSYSMLLAADAAGALLAGFVLEAGDCCSRCRGPRSFSPCCGAALLAFALSRSYPLALALLFAAGFFELSFNAMAQTLVQINAPADIRGRVIGLFNMAGLGMRAFSGVRSACRRLIGIHWSLGLSAVVLLACFWSSISGPAARHRRPTV